MSIRLILWLAAHICLSWPAVALPLPLQLGLKHEVVARERMGGVGHRKIMHWENNKAKHPGVQPFTVLQGSMARWVGGSMGGRVRW